MKTPQNYDNQCILPLIQQPVVPIVYNDVVNELSSARSSTDRASDYGSEG